MTLIDADIFLEYLIFSKHIDSLKCREVKEAVEMSKVDVLDKIRAEIEKAVWEDVVVSLDGTDEVRIPRLEPDDVFEIIDNYKAKSDDTISRPSVIEDIKAEIEEYKHRQLNMGIGIKDLEIGKQTAIEYIEAIIDRHISGAKMEVDEKSCSNCKFWLLDKNDKNRRCQYCYRQDEWQAESEDKE